MTVSVSPNGKNFYETSGAENEVLVATANGVVAISRSGPGGAWSESRRMLEGKHAGSIAVDQRSGTIFVGVHKGGLWASADSGKTWERRDSGIESDDIYGLNCVQAGNETRIYAGTEPAHLYVSTDLGRSWTELKGILSMPSKDKWTFPAPPHEGHVKNIEFDRENPDTFYVGVEVGGAFKTTDAGKTFTEMTGFYEDVHRLHTVSSKPNDVYMSTGKGLYHSADKGGNWEEYSIKPSTGIDYPDALVISPQKPELMFTAGSSGSPGSWRTSKDADSRFARSRDAGQTWARLQGGLPGHVRGNIEAMTMNAFPGGFSLFAGTTDGDVFFSDDEGESWTTIGKGLPPVSKGGHFRNLREDAVGAAR
jgi:photosystem II stability/assembly factor-like uncharacterized protein